MHLVRDAPHEGTPVIDDLTRFTLQSLMIGSTSCGVDNKRNVLLLRAFTGTEREEVMAMIIAARRKHRTHTTMLQRYWQTRTSRRPQRGRHYDSWSIRERYVRTQP